MATSKSSKPKKTAPDEASEHIPATIKLSGIIQNDQRTSSQAKHPHPAATRQEIRATDHRTMGARQSKKPGERTNQRRQPKTGGAGGHGMAGKADRTARTSSKK